MTSIELDQFASLNVLNVLGGEDLFVLSLGESDV